MTADLAVAPPSYRPPGVLDLSTALEPYTGPWALRHAAHLYRRAGFGGSPADVARATAAGMHAAVDSFVRFADTSALPAAPADLVPDRFRPLQAGEDRTEVAKMLGRARRCKKR